MINPSVAPSLPAEAVQWIEHFIETTSLEGQVAQRMIIGLPEGRHLNPTQPEMSILSYFIEQGVGGLIWFRSQFKDLETVAGSSQAAHKARTRIQDIQALFPTNAPLPWMAIDQEGGPVERLAHTLFPSLPSPYAVAQGGTESAETIYTLLANSLYWMGFNLNFFPTLDVNLQPLNPVIGVRSFGDTAETVWKYSHIALKAHWRQGVLPCIKHFPGHGNGAVDSHEKLPTLHFTEEELTPFQQAIQWGASIQGPVLMMSHGFYPALQTTPEEFQLPASLSPTIITALLREKLGFEGVVITDDLYMGAVLDNFTPEQTALKALQAGVDVLLYRQVTQLERHVLQFITAALQSGRLCLQAHKNALRRILALKWHQQQVVSSLTIPLIPWETDPVSIADSVAEKMLTVLNKPQQTHASSSASEKIRLWVLCPAREAMHQYQEDVATSDSLQKLFQQLPGISLQYWEYNPKAALEGLNTVNAGCKSLLEPSHLLVVTQNPFTQEALNVWLPEFKANYPDCTVILAPIGLSERAYASSQVACVAQWEVGLFSYRPAMLRALVNWFAKTFVLLKPVK